MGWGRLLSVNIGKQAVPNYENGVAWMEMTNEAETYHWRRTWRVELQYFTLAARRQDNEKERREDNESAAPLPLTG